MHRPSSIVVWRPWPSGPSLIDHPELPDARRHRDRPGSARRDVRFQLRARRSRLQLDGVRFARDVAVEGQATLSYDGNEMQMELTVTGPDPAHSGTLEAQGAFGFGAPYRDFSVTGVIGGRTLVASVPAN